MALARGGRLKVQPGTVTGTIEVPGSKSWTHRAYVLAATADGPVRLRGVLRAADPDATLRCIRDWGIDVDVDETITIHGGRPHPTGTLDCANAGTGLRLLTGVAARLPFPTTFTGDDSLQRRPNGPLLDALRGLGATIDGDRDGRCPYTVTGPMHGGTIRLAGGTSSQYASSLMLSLPQLRGESRLILEPPVRSRPYLAITRRCLDAFGIALDDGDDIMIQGEQTPRAGDIQIPADWSSAAFPMAAAAVTNGDVTLRGLDPDDPQGDRAIVDLLQSFGARIDVADAVRVRGADLHSPGTIDVEDTPDLFPILCIVAAASRGTTTFTGGATLRHKESDRIAAMAAGLAAMGIQTQEQPDGLIVHGGRLQGATPPISDDHRIHMAFYVAALAADGPSEIGQESSTMISFPGFHDAMAAMAGAA